MLENDGVITVSAGEFKLAGKSIRAMGNGIVEFEYTHSGLQWKSGNVCGLLPMVGEIHELPYKKNTRWFIGAGDLFEFTRLIPSEILQYENIVNGRASRATICENAINELIGLKGVAVESMREICKEYLGDFHDIKNSIPKVNIVFHNEMMILTILPSFSMAYVSVDIGYITDKDRLSQINDNR